MGMNRNMSDTFVIVGAALAGAKAAETLREEGFDGSVVLLGAEPHRPYERPPLSKDYLRGEAERDAAFVHEEGFYAEKDIDLRTSSPVESVDADAREVQLESGERIGYSKLLLAPGAEPRVLPLPGADLDGVHYLRTFEDSDALRAAIEKGGHAVVIGAGWIGSEVGASARTKGMDVTLIEQLSVPLERVIGPEVGEIYAAIHRDHGTEVLGGTGVEAIEGDGRAERVRLKGGKTVDADLVVVGVGVAPRTKLAQVAGLATDNGILADERLATAAGDIFVAGDAANAYHPFYEQRVRVEHWHNALEQGPAAARNMLGKGDPYDRIPYFFSDQYDVGMEYAGHATSYDEVVFRGDVDGREFIAFWLQGGRVLAGMNVNVWDVTDDIQALIRSRAEVDAGSLRDPEVSLGDLVKERG
jgi:3-phenylpropionate/trans-cinnamate dioxygenase ferredoxin reductase component